MPRRLAEEPPATRPQTHRIFLFPKGLAVMEQVQKAWARAGALLLPTRSSNTGGAPHRQHLRADLWRTAKPMGSTNADPNTVRTYAGRHSALATRRRYGRQAPATYAGHVTRLTASWATAILDPR